MAREGRLLYLVVTDDVADVLAESAAITCGTPGPLDVDLRHPQLPSASRGRELATAGTCLAFS